MTIAKSISRKYVRSRGWSEDNLLALWATIPDDFKQQTRYFYRDALEEYTKIARRVMHTVEYTVLVGAISSIKKRPEVERKLAERFLRTGSMAGYMRGAQRNQIERIAQGAHPQSVISGPKITRYAKAILSGGRADVAVIDQWAVRAMDGFDWIDTIHIDATLSATGYAEIENFYKLAAYKVGWLPSEFQSVIWHWVRQGVQ